MIITATQKNTRQTALKVRLVANQVRKLPLTDAVQQLGVMQKKASLVVLKVLRQAIANAVHNHGFSVEELTLKSITATPGPTYRRFRAVSRGRAHTIFKRTCHVSVELEAGVAPKVAKEAEEKSKDTKVETKTEVTAEAKKVEKKTTSKKTSVKKAKK